MILSFRENPGRAMSDTHQSRSKILYVSAVVLLAAVSLWFSWRMERVGAIQDAMRRTAACGHRLGRPAVIAGVEKQHLSLPWGYAADAFVKAVCPGTVTDPGETPSGASPN
jgi:hypothetical protein